MKENNNNPNNTTLIKLIYLFRVFSSTHFISYAQRPYVADWEVYILITSFNTWGKTKVENGNGYEEGQVMTDNDQVRQQVGPLGLLSPFLECEKCHNFLLEK